MIKNAWEYTLEFIKIATDIDYYNDMLGNCHNISEREFISSKIDILETKLFEVRNILRNANV